jgi:hypothetical protein
VKFLSCDPHSIKKCVVSKINHPNRSMPKPQHRLGL